MFKKAFVASVFASLSLLVVACGDNAKDACEHINELCANQPGFPKLDCSKANDDYDKLTDEQKKDADKQIECVMEKNSCAEVLTCGSARPDTTPDDEDETE